MSTKRGKKGDILLEMKDIRIDGFSDERWHKIIRGIDLTLHRGEVMGLIGESGAGKSTLGLASMGFTKPGCKITSGSVVFDGKDLVTASEDEKRSPIFSGSGNCNCLYKSRASASAKSRDCKF